MHIQSTFALSLKLLRTIESMSARDGEAEWYDLLLVAGGALLVQGNHQEEIIIGRWESEICQDSIDDSMCLFVFRGKTGHERMRGAGWAAQAGPLLASRPIHDENDRIVPLTALPPE